MTSAHDDQTPSSSSPSPAASANRRKTGPILLVAIPLIVACAFALYLVFGGRYASTENAYLRAPLVNLAAEVAGRIDAIRVHENQPVNAGDVLLSIDPEPFEIRVAQAQARLRQAEFTIRTLKASYASMQEELALAQENVEFAQRELNREQTLAERNLTSRSELDTLRHQVATSERRKATLGRELERIAASLGGDPNLPIDQHPDYQTALASLNAARLDLARTQVTAPFDGIVAKVPEPGTYASPGMALLSLIGTQGLWLEANFKETELARIRPGQPVEIEIDSYPDHALQGRVDSLAYATGAEFAVLPAQNATGNWVKVVQRIPVRIQLTQAPDELPLRSGMSAHVAVDTGYPATDNSPVAWLRGLVSSARAHEGEH